MRIKNFFRYLFYPVGVILLILQPVTVGAAEPDLQNNQTVQQQIDALQQQVDDAAEWKHPGTLIHMAGYADVGYVDTESSDGSYVVGTFSPIFHYQYKDLVMLESELELELGETGETELAVEYVTIDIFLNDYVALVMGKFLSPIGQFRQNLHPSWINKQPTAPIGFGHDEAAPNAEVGLQFRGGVPAGSVKLNYALYAGNGPALEADAGEGELEMIETPGLNADGDGNKVYGGRIGVYVPAIKLEVGASAAAGKAAVWDPDADPVTYERSRDYQVIGADFAVKVFSVDLRGEYVKQMVGELASSVAPEEAEWSAWYTQVAYLISPIKLEIALRYGAYNTPHRSLNRTQSAISFNYLFANNVIGKLAYESNDNPNDLQPKAKVDNRFLVQLAYGF